MKLKNDFDVNYLPRSLYSKNFFYIDKGWTFQPYASTSRKQRSIWGQCRMLFKVKGRLLNKLLLKQFYRLEFLHYYKNP